MLVACCALEILFSQAVHTERVQKQPGVYIQDNGHLQRNLSRPSSVLLRLKTPGFSLCCKYQRQYGVAWESSTGSLSQIQELTASNSILNIHLFTISSHDVSELSACEQRAIGSPRDHTAAALNKDRTNARVLL